MSSLIDLLNETTPLYPPFGRLAVVAGLFLVAWLVAKLAGVVAAFVIDRSDRRRGGDGDVLDTGVIAGLKQRETAISLVQTSVRYLAFGLAAALSIATLVGARRIDAIVGASFVAVILAFAAQRFLTDLIAGLLMYFERWFRVGDTIVIEPWKLQGVVEQVSLRSIAVRGLDGEIMHVHNSEVKATRVAPRGYRELEIELYVSELEAGRELVEHVAGIVPAGPTHFVRRPALEEEEELDVDLFRLRLRAAVAPGREWLADDFLPRVLEERAREGLVVHGPVVMSVDDQATLRFARAARSDGRRRERRLYSRREGGQSPARIERG